MQGNEIIIGFAALVGGIHFTIADNLLIKFWHEWGKNRSKFSTINVKGFLINFALATHFAYTTILLFCLYALYAFLPQIVWWFLSAFLFILFPFRGLILSL